VLYHYANIPSQHRPSVSDGHCFVHSFGSIQKHRCRCLSFEGSPCTNPQGRSSGKPSAALATCSNRHDLSAWLSLLKGAFREEKGAGWWGAEGIALTVGDQRHQCFTNAWLTPHPLHEGFFIFPTSIKYDSLKILPLDLVHSFFENEDRGSENKENWNRVEVWKWQIHRAFFFWAPRKELHQPSRQENIKLHIAESAYLSTKTHTHTVDGPQGSC
jgi:hypothetical protein